MNMKKTMAAIAACAVAVSAMATTVSAVEDQTLNYDLKLSTDVYTAGTAVLTATFAGVDPSTNTAIGIKNIPSTYEVVDVTITIKDTSGDAGSKVLKYSNDWNADYYYWDAADGIVVVDGKAVNGITDADVTVNVKVKHDLTGWATPGALAPTLDAAGTIGAIGVWDWATNALDGTETTSTVLASGVTQATKTTLQRPMETTLNNNYDIIDYLTDKGYVNVGPVLNDAIENYETTTFIFNSAKDRVRFEAVVEDAVTDEATLTGLKSATKAGAFEKVNTEIAKLNNELGKLEKALEDAEAAVADPENPTDDETAAIEAAQKAVDEKVAVLEKWEAADVLWYYTTETDDSTDYSKFTQHLYNGQVSDYFFAKDPSGYLGLDWAGYNLFQGGLVINEGWTMSLADTTMFDWGESTVSFNWDAIADAAQTSNAYALYLHTMELATSVDWYWDSMDVVLTAGAVDDATSDAEAEADDETLDEEPIEEEEIVEEEIVEEEIVEEEEVVEEEVVEEEEVEVSNPTTGNASVALAVIPVALAAAAVVAKKRS